VQPWVGALTWGRPAPLGSASSGSRAEEFGGGKQDVFARLIARFTQGEIKGRGGRSEAFALPGLKGAAVAEEVKTVKGGEANRGKPA